MECIQSSCLHWLHTLATTRSILTHKCLFLVSYNTYWVRQNHAIKWNLCSNHGNSFYKLNSVKFVYILLCHLSITFIFYLCFCVWIDTCHFICFSIPLFPFSYFLLHYFYKIFCLYPILYEIQLWLIKMFEFIYDGTQIIHSFSTRNY